jgi:coenzyme A diphosphatase NUDT7
MISFPKIPSNHSPIIGINHRKKCAVTIPLFLQDGEWFVLFQIRAKGISQEGEVSFPGGKFEEGIDSSLQDTALRETIEELGVRADQIEIKEKFGTLITANGIALSAYTAQLNIKTVSDCNFNRDEVESLFAVPLNWFKENKPESYHVRLEVHPFTDEDGEKKFHLPAEELKLPNRYHNSWGNHQLPVYVYKREEAVIWGMTAEIIREFVEVL